MTEPSGVSMFGILIAVGAWSPVLLHLFVVAGLVLTLASPVRHVPEVFIFSMLGPLAFFHFLLPCLIVLFGRMSDKTEALWAVATMSGFQFPLLIIYGAGLAKVAYAVRKQAAAAGGEV